MRPGRRGPRAAATAALLLIGLAALGRPAEAAHEPGAAPVLLIVLPEHDARAVAAAQDAATGLGVLPASRDGGDFLYETGTGVPDLARAKRLRRSRVRDAIEPGASVAVAAAESLDPAYRRLAERTFGGAVSGSETTVTGALSADVAVLLLEHRADAEAVMRVSGARAIIVGASARTPVFVADTGHAGLLVGEARRPGVVTPYDISASLVAAAGQDQPAAFAGRPLEGDSHAGGAEALGALRERMLRDAAFGQPLTAATVAAGIAALLAAALAVWASRLRLARRFVQAAAFVPAGYLAALFVQSGRWELRAIPLAGSVVLGFALPPARWRAVVAAGLGGTAAAVAVLAVLAELRPAGEPALSLWGDPLVSWRFFGLRNHLVAFLGGGLLTAAGVAGAPALALAPLAAAALLVAGTPVLGANYVGVAWLALGATTSLLVLASRRLRLWHLLVAAVAGAGALALALAADRTAEISHGGATTRRIAGEGFEAVREIVERRAALNIDEIGRFFGGWVWTAMIVASLLAALVWTARRPAAGRPADAALRGAVAGGAAASLAALVAEDSGFYTAAILWFTTAIAFFVWWIGAGDDRAAGGAPSLRDTGPIPVAGPPDGGGPPPPPGASGGRG